MLDDGRRHLRRLSRRILLWEGTDAWRANAATLDHDESGWRATGVQLGRDPCPYRIDYRLRVDRAFVTRTLQAEAAGAEWRRELDLAHDGEGRWRIAARSEGAPELGDPGGDPAQLAGALDCDIGGCPLTNFMPIRRHDLHARPVAVDFLMAWVSVPDLAVSPSRQRYEHVGWREGMPVVRYVGEHRDFVAELTLDDEGLVVDYPQLARRVAPRPDPGHRPR